MTVHAFVDEAKRPRYVIVAAIVAPNNLVPVRRALRGLLLGNQRRIHFKDERDARKRQIIELMAGMPLTARIYVCPATVTELEARKAGLRQLVPDLAALGATRLVFERDDSLLTHDRQTLYDAVDKAGCRETLSYDHLRAHEESMLWVADAVAWCWSHGTDWRHRVRPIINEIITLG
jgi:hypothetical protein